MPGLVLAFLAVAAAPADPAVRKQGRATGAVASRCVEGTPDPLFGGSRPLQTAHCPYDIGGARARLLDLLTVREGRLDLDYAERLFGLPKLSTALITPRAVDYSVRFEGGTGEDTWRALLFFREDFGPDLETRPIRFRGGKRPRHVRPGERGEIRLWIEFFARDPEPPGKGCLTVSEFHRRALAADWTPPSQRPVMPHGGPPTLILERGGLRLFPDNISTAVCLSRVLLVQAPDPPIPPITDADRERLRRQAR